MPEHIARQNRLMLLSLCPYRHCRPCSHACMPRHTGRLAAGPKPPPTPPHPALPCSALPCPALLLQRSDVLYASAAVNAAVGALCLWQGFREED